MGNNREIAGIFYEIADMLEFQNVAWKPIAYRRAAESLEALKDDVSKIYKSGGLKALEEIPNIGEKLGEKIVDYLKRGKIKEYERLKKESPRVAELMKIPGIGPKRIKKLSSSLKISNLDQLKKAIKLHRIAKLPGFGETSEDEMLESIRNFEQSKGKRYSFRAAQKEAQKVVNELKKIKEVDRIDLGGSLRRKKSTIGDIDILVLSDSPESVVEAFVKMKNVKDVLAKGPTKATVILKSGMQVDVRLLPKESYGAALLYFTGNKNYNIYMRRIAIEKGWKLNEYGLFDRKTGKLVAGKTEEEIFKKLGMKYLPPEKREI